MARKIIFLIGILTLTIAILMGSCGKITTPTTSVTTIQPTTTTASPTGTSTPTTTTASPTVTSTPTTKPTTATTTEEPKYGGTLTVCYANDPTSYDPRSSNNGFFTQMFAEKMANVDIYTDKFGFTGADFPLPPYDNGIWVGQLAESWEIPDINTIIFHLRQGIRFNAGSDDMRKLTGDREFTSADVVWWYNDFVLAPTSVADKGYVGEMKPVKALDKYTVEFKWDPPNQCAWIATCRADFAVLVARESWDKDKSFKEPKNFIGTGPYILKDYVTRSSYLWVRNPNYWMKDPAHPKNTLPYTDNVEWIVVPDKSTQVAAMRTGKIDLTFTGVTFQNSQVADLLKTNPELKERKYPGSTEEFVHCNVMNAPYNNIKVRYALSMAIDREGLMSGYWAGPCSYLNYPVPEKFATYIKFDNLPAELQEIYTYNVDKAKQLLKEAGFPNGFKTSIIVSNTDLSGIDQCQLLQSMWAKLGVDLEIKVVDNAVSTDMFYNHTYTGLGKKYGGFSWEGFYIGWNYQPQDANGKDVYMNRNFSNVHDPVFNKMWEDWGVSIGQDNRDKFDALYKYVLKQCWNIPLPYPYSNRVWQPWVKNYWGQLDINYYSSGAMYKFMWIDQTLKKQITGK